MCAVDDRDCLRLLPGHVALEVRAEQGVDDRVASVKGTAERLGTIIALPRHTASGRNFQVGARQFVHPSGISEDENFDVRVLRLEPTCGHETGSRCVSASTEHHNALAGGTALALQHVERRESGVLHDDGLRHAELGESASVDVLHLVEGADLHGPILREPFRER